MDPEHQIQIMQFLSSNAQDFIEDCPCRYGSTPTPAFLSSNAQDFIEEWNRNAGAYAGSQFLSSNAQDFIEEDPLAVVVFGLVGIPEQ